MIQIQGLTPLGQIAQTQEAYYPVSPQPILRLPGQAYAQMAETWTFLYDQCEKLLTPAQCRQLMGYRPIFTDERSLAPGRIKWYWWIVVGFLAGRFVKIL